MFIFKLQCPPLWYNSLLIIKKPNPGYNPLIFFKKKNNIVEGILNAMVDVKISADVVKEATLFVKNCKSGKNPNHQYSE